MPKKKKIECKSYGCDSYDYIANLSHEQRQAFERMIQGNNFFLSGKAGTGKSFVTQAFIQWCKKNRKNVMITAPTGIAAININGATIHRAFQAPVKPLIDDTKKVRVPGEVRAADIIIIDEISMCRIDLFEYVAKVILKSEEMTGKRIQLIVIGDFFQLPPVSGKTDTPILKEKYPDSKKFYAFESTYWKDLGFDSYILKEVVRQDDPEFIKQLNRARVGNTACIEYFNRRYSTKKIEGGITLCGTNETVRKINAAELEKISGKSKHYDAVYTGSFKPSDCLAEERLELKVGARVMSLINDREKDSYQNGSLGTVTELSNASVSVCFDNGENVNFVNNVWETTDYEVETVLDEYGNEAKKLNSKVIGTCSQIPLKLAYAITMHKSQGQTFDKVNLIPKSFDVGQLYVALSRVRSIDGLVLIQRMITSYLKSDESVFKFYSSLVKEKKEEKEKELSFGSADLLGQYMLSLDDETFEQLPQEIKSVISLSKSRIYGDEIQQSEKTAAEEKKEAAIESVQPEPVKKIVTEPEKKRFIEFRESSIADFVDTFDLDHPFELGICVEESAGQYTTVPTAEGFGQMSFF